MMRKMHFSGEILLVLSLFPSYFKSETNTNFDEIKSLNQIKEFMCSLAREFQSIKSIYISHNGNKADTLIGDMELVYGNETISENVGQLIKKNLLFLATILPFLTRV